MMRLLQRVQNSRLFYKRAAAIVQRVKYRLCRHRLLLQPEDLGIEAYLAVQCSNDIFGRHKPHAFAGIDVELPRCG